jgi:hypothetical protein
MAPKQKRVPAIKLKPFLVLAERTGLEPATSGVTGRHSNQLNYRSLLSFGIWWAEQGLNL